MPKTRSGTKWTEADYEAAGYVRIQPRLKRSVYRRLQASCADEGLSMAEWIEWALDRIGAPKRGGKKPVKE